MYTKNNLLVMLIMALSLWSCGDAIEYNYSNRKHVVSCEGIDKDLMNEALYSFEDNIARASTNNRFDPGTETYYSYGYASYIYRGVMGESNYQKIASQHSQALAKALAKEPIWKGEKPNLTLDYDSPFVTCLVKNVEHETLKLTFDNLKAANSMDIKLMINVFMKHVSETTVDKELAVIVALDTYYRHLINETVYVPIND